MPLARGRWIQLEAAMQQRQMLSQPAFHRSPPRCDELHKVRQCSSCHLVVSTSQFPASRVVLCGVCDLRSYRQRFAVIVEAVSPLPYPRAPIPSGRMRNPLVRLGSGVWSMKRRVGMELKFDIMRRDGMLRDTRGGRWAMGDWRLVTARGLESTGVRYGEW